MTLIRKPTPSRLRVRPILQHLGLPPNSRWEQAAPKVKEKIVSARRSKADDVAAFWSEAKSFLKRNLKRLCPCGTVIAGPQRRCFLCNQKDLHPNPSPRGR